MSCAACSARVEKAVSKVPGVNSCSVSLLTNSMGVEGTASSGEIIAAVEAAGYGASLKGGAAGAKISMSAAEEALEDHDDTVYLHAGVSDRHSGVCDLPGTNCQ